MPRRLLASRLAAAIASSCSCSCSRVASNALASTSALAGQDSLWLSRQTETIFARPQRSFARCFSSPSPSPPPTPPPSTPKRPEATSAAPPCWSCGNQLESTARPSLVCGSCRAVQPLELVFGGGAGGGAGGGGGGSEGTTSTSTSPSPSLSSSSSSSFPDPFSLLGLPRSFDVDPRALEASYRSLQAQLHPDKHHHHHRHSPSSSVSAAEEASAAVNAAVALLRCPLARARYLLDGARPDREEEEGGGDGRERDLFDDDPELLAEVMEAREEVEEAAEAAAAAAAAKRKNENDDDDDDKSSCPLAALRDKHERAAEGITRQLSEAFAREDLKEARRLTVRLRYATRILQAVTEKM